MQGVVEYTECPGCHKLAKVERRKGYRDRLLCSHCGLVSVTDNLPKGIYAKVTSADDEDS